MNISEEHSDGDWGPGSPTRSPTRRGVGEQRGSGTGNGMSLARVDADTTADVVSMPDVNLQPPANLEDLWEQLLEDTLPPDKRESLMDQWHGTAGKEEKYMMFLEYFFAINTKTSGKYSQHIGRTRKYHRKKSFRRDVKFRAEIIVKFRTPMTRGPRRSRNRSDTAVISGGARCHLRNGPRARRSSSP